MRCLSPFFPNALNSLTIKCVITESEFVTLDKKFARFLRSAQRLAARCHSARRRGQQTLCSVNSIPSTSTRFCQNLSDRQALPSHLAGDLTSLLLVARTVVQPPELTYNWTEEQSKPALRTRNRVAPASFPVHLAFLLLTFFTAGVSR